MTLLHCAIIGRETHFKVFLRDILPYTVKISEPQHDISNNVVCATSKGPDQPAHTRSLIRAVASRLLSY